MRYELLNVLVFAAVGIAFCAISVAVLGKLLRPRVRSIAEPSKEETYECGEPAMGSSWVRFDNRFYAVALVFLIFDVEVAFLYPWALVFKPFRDSGLGWFVFLEAAVFVGILTVGFGYAWCKGDLSWVKETGRKAFPLDRLPQPRGKEGTVASGQRANSIPGAQT